MIALVLAVAISPDLPPEMAQSCDQAKLEPFLSAPRKDKINNEMELDRRIQAALAGERATAKEVEDAAATVVAARATATRGRWVAVLLVIAGLGLGLTATRRRARGTTLVAAALPAAGAIVALLVAGRATEATAAHQALTERQLHYSECRARVTETRRQLMHARIATYTHDLDELDEDIWGWVGRFRADGKMPGVAELEKMHEEIRNSLKY